MTTTTSILSTNSAHLADSRYAWMRLFAVLLLMTIGSGAMYVIAVVLPPVQAEFGVARADASLPYTLMMVGFGLGGVAMGKLADRCGVMVVAMIGAVGLGLGYVAAGMAGSLTTFALAHGILLGALGSSTTFAPLVADTSLWFVRRRGIAVAICASGNYVAGAVWPPIVQHFVEVVGWRQTYLGLGAFSFVAMIGAVGLGAGFVAAGMAGSLTAFALAHGILLGALGSSTTFAPLVADTSLWFVRRRGIAVAICASGNYLAGAVWPPIVQHFVEIAGWRQTYVGLGAFSFVTMSLLALALRPRPPALAAEEVTQGSGGVVPSTRPFGLSMGHAQGLLCIAGVACCVAMAMPQVHIVAYCGDLGYGAARGAQMLSLMLGAGIVSRLVSGLICDRIGGLRTLLLGSVLQGIALLLFLPFDGLVSLYVISALFGLFQGGIVPSYAIIVREHFPAAEAGARVGTVIMATLFGMALGGWMSGKVFDLTGSYHAAFLNGIVWNLLNLTIALFLLGRMRTQRGRTRGLAGAAK